MSKPVSYLRKLIVAIIGIPLLVLGAILVPLPGPGFLVMFIALALLSTEFEWAGKHADKIKSKFKEIYEKSMAKADAIEKKANETKKSK